MSPSSSSHNLTSDRAKVECLHIRKQKYTEFHVSNFRSRQFVLEPVGETSIFLVPWDLTFKDILFTKPQTSNYTQNFQTLSE